jgi:hypothetical protein
MAAGFLHSTGASADFFAHLFSKQLIDAARRSIVVDPIFDQPSGARSIGLLIARAA